MVEHHYSGDDEILQRFIDQASGTAKQEFPNGKMSEQDEGELAFAIALDTKARVIRIDFNKPVTWLGMDLESARNLKRELSLKVAELELIFPQL